MSADRDIEYLCQNYGTGPNNPEQLLLDTYVSILLIRGERWMDGWMDGCIDRRIDKWIDHG